MKKLRSVNKTRWKIYESQKIVKDK
jgi:hypothetical protein